MLLVPLVGTPSVTGSGGDAASGWLLHRRRRVLLSRGDGPHAALHAGAALLPAMMEVHRESRLRNQQRLRALAERESGTVGIFSAHDMVEFEQRVAPVPDPLKPVRVAGRYSRSPG